jgi:precorrin-6A/cobalt-precorrin-6A reductase
MKILIFGGTGEARELANRLVALGHEVTTSLAGVTTPPSLPPGYTRTGGYGDYAGMLDYLRQEKFDRVVDATHPFAVNISMSVASAGDELEIAILRLVRPPWEKPKGAEWTDIWAIENVRGLIPKGAVLLVTTGQPNNRLFGMLPLDCKRIIRLIEPPDPSKELSGNDTIVLDRPPYSVTGEKALMREHGVTHLLTKNSGGDQTRAKIDAATELGIPVFMVRRPWLPPVTQEVATVDEAVAVLQDSAR